MQNKARDKNRITDKNSKKGDREREKGVKKRKSVSRGGIPQISGGKREQDVVRRGKQTLYERVCWNMITYLPLFRFFPRKIRHATVDSIDH